MLHRTESVNSLDPFGSGFYSSPLPGCPPVPPLKMAYISLTDWTCLDVEKYLQMVDWVCETERATIKRTIFYGGSKKIIGTAAGKKETFDDLMDLVGEMIHRCPKTVIMGPTPAYRGGNDIDECYKSYNELCKAWSRACANRLPLQKLNKKHSETMAAAAPTTPPIAIVVDLSKGLTERLYADLVVYKIINPDGSTLHPRATRNMRILANEMCGAVSMVLVDEIKMESNSPVVVTCRNKLAGRVSSLLADALLPAIRSLTDFDRSVTAETMAGAEWIDKGLYVKWRGAVKDNARRMRMMRSSPYFRTDRQLLRQTLEENSSSSTSDLILKLMTECQRSSSVVDKKRIGELRRIKRIKNVIGFKKTQILLTRK